MWTFVDLINKGPSVISVIFMHSSFPFQLVEIRKYIVNIHQTPCPAGLFLDYWTFVYKGFVHKRAAATESFLFGYGHVVTL
jgi:hypothetical protein